jgi:hypothetical protein
MKNKERIEQLEKQVEVLANRIAILEMRATPKVMPPTPAAPAPIPTTWPTYPNFILTPLKYEPWHYQVTCESTKH